MTIQPSTQSAHSTWTDRTYTPPRFAVLGPVGYLHDGALRVPSGARQQKLLAALLLSVGRVVPEGSLVEALWEGEPPMTAGRQVGNGISMLRRESAVLKESIMRFPGGYALSVDEQQTDYGLFKRHRAAAREAMEGGEFDGAADQLYRALGLWRGQALSGVDSIALGTVAESLEQQRLNVYSELGRIELRRRQYVDVLDLFADAVRLAPFEERFAILRATALVGLSRRREALDTCQRFHQKIHSELGCEPTREFVELHRAISQGATIDEVVGM
jgi:DNA-binding SARP family transcriptional activator